MCFRFSIEMKVAIYSKIMRVRRKHENGGDFPQVVVSMDIFL